MKPIHVYLDDLRPCPKGFVLAKNMEECVELLTSCEVDILSLDHDLGWDEPTGYDVAKYIVEHRLYPKVIYLHSANPVGRMNMYQLLYRYKPDHVKIYNSPVPEHVLEQIARSADLVNEQ